MEKQVGAAAAVVAAAAALSACGSEGGSGRSGADLACRQVAGRWYADQVDACE